jgi:cysteinyl-tRNA synthetase
MLKLTNTLSGKKEEFVSLVPHKVSMYVCGITPYDNAHVGHGRVYVSFDILYRLLQSLHYDVAYCRNLTDIDDKILKKAAENFGSKMRYADVTKPVIDSYHENMQALNCLSPDFEPRVTENIDIIIDFVQKLIAAGKAYESNGDVYFRVREFSDYGKLSKHKLEDLRAGARVDVSEKKDDPLDFALWKGEPEGEFWKSPWGWGRPGWHIECSAMAGKYLGSEIDIHAGGLDLIFPHHENEIAQTEALTGKPFARYWLHNGFVMINHEKMSKSLGNFFTLLDIFKQFDPMVVRYYFITHQYKAPLDFSFQDMTVAHKSYQRLTRLLDSVECDEEAPLYYDSLKSDTAKRMMNFLLDDMNTPGMLGVIFESVDLLKSDKDTLCEVKLILQKILGLTCKPLPEEETVLTSEIQQLIAEREDARAAKDWARADAIRDQLKELGYQVQDKKMK